MKEIKKLKDSFRYAFNGLCFIIHNERNFRIHIIITCYIIYFSKYYMFSKQEYATLILTICVVLFTEIINTAIEHIVNFLSPSYSMFAKITKDIAACGVLISAIAATTIGIIYFFDMNIISLIVDDFISHWIKLLLFLISIILSLMIILKNTKNNPLP